MVQPFISDSLQFRDDIIWKTISSIVMWVIWKARCTSIFDNTTQDFYVIIAEFWLLLIHTLHGQYECFTGNVDAIFRKQMHFKRLWDSMLIFREDRDHIIWMYIVPSFWETMSTKFVYGLCCYRWWYRLHCMLICNLGGVRP